MKNSPVREKIVETASHLFYSKGYNLTGINEIIKEAGVAKATLYNHFESKDQICLAYLDHKHTHFMENIQVFCEEKPEGEEQVLAVFDFLKAFFVDKGFNGCWCLNTISELPVDQKDIKGEIQKQKGEFLRFIERIISYKSTHAEEVTRLAKQIYLLYEGAVNESKLHGAPWPIESAKEMAQMILNK